MSKNRDIWAIYFATKALKTPKVSISEGQVFPYQDKFIIRGFGRAYGVPDADKLSFGDLPYIKALDVGTEDMARQIIDRNLSFKDAKKLVSGPTQHAVGVAANG